MRACADLDQAASTAAASSTFQATAGSKKSATAKAAAERKSKTVEGSVKSTSGGGKQIQTSALNMSIKYIRNHSRVTPKAAVANDANSPHMTGMSKHGKVQRTVRLQSAVRAGYCQSDRSLALLLQDPQLLGGSLHHRQLLLKSVWTLLEMVRRMRPMQPVM